MGTENKPIDGFKAWKDDIDRRLTQQERRSQIYDGPQLLGPGFGATGTQIIDWNDEDVLFNGYYWSPVDSLNSPDDTLEWAGHVIAQDNNAHGVQTAWSMSTGDPPSTYVRRFENLGVTTPTFTPWRQVGGGSFIVVIHGDDGTVARPDADLVYWVGAATPDNAIAYDFWFTATV